MHSFTRILPEQYALGSLQVLGWAGLSGRLSRVGSELIRLGSSFEVTSGRVLVNLGRFQVRLLGRLKVHSDFGFQHALFVGDMT